MKISALNNCFLPTRIQNTNSTTPFIQKNNNQGDIFISFKSDIYPNRIIPNKMKFDISDYKKLSPKQKEKIRYTKCAPTDRKRAETNIELAIELKENLDKEYGEGNYVFECIGTSPSLIARVFEFMGVETHYIPISDLRDVELYRLHDIINNSHWDKKHYENYLNQQGINSEMLKDNDKHYLFFDYTYSGNSLNLFKEILQDEFNMPKSDRIEFISLNQKLYTFLDDELTAYEKKHNCLLDPFSASEKAQKIMNYVENNFRCSAAATYGGIQHCPIYSLEAIKEVGQLNRHHWENYQKYNFCVIDKLNEMGLLKENPKNNGVL